jgi:hypothetical protein
MGLILRASGFFESRYLQIKKGMVYVPSLSFLGGRKRYAFSEIEYVLITSNNVLSFQAGQDVFSIQTRPYKQKHEAVMQALLDGVRGTAAPPPPPQV